VKYDTVVKASNLSKQITSARSLTNTNSLLQSLSFIHAHVQKAQVYHTMSHDTERASGQFAGTQSSIYWPEHSMEGDDQYKGEFPTAHIPVHVCFVFREPLSSTVHLPAQSQGPDCRAGSYQPVRTDIWPCGSATEGALSRNVEPE
jgi:hypothetical protein